jgi:hypothetical protein
MTIHAPAHPSGAVTPQAHHHYLAWLGVTAAVILAIGAVLLMPADMLRTTSPLSTEAQSLIEYRAAERLSFVEGRAYPEWKALVEFRAAEREGR